jgi:general secretion pathway protein H
MTREGFTLIELVVILLIVTLMFLFAAPQLENILPQMELRSGARELAAALRESRSRAVMSNSDVVFRLDVKRRQYSISGDNEIHPLTSNARISLQAAQEERGSESTGGIRFFPDGSSTGGSIVLSNSTKSYKVSVDWLTGRVVVEN